MTTYIDSPEVSAGPSVEPAAVGPATPNLAMFSDMAPGLFALWTLPLAGFQMWMHGWSAMVGNCKPETDRVGEGRQLPVPNPLQEAKDRELFA